MLLAFFVLELLDAEATVLHLEGFFEELECLGGPAVVFGQFLGDADQDLGYVEECVGIVRVEIKSVTVRREGGIQDCYQWRVEVTDK